MATQLWRLPNLDSQILTSNNLRAHVCYSRIIHVDNTLANFVSPQTAGGDDASSWQYRGRSIDRCCFQMPMTACNWQATKIGPLSLWSQLCDTMVNVFERLIFEPIFHLISLQAAGVPGKRITTNKCQLNEHYLTKFLYCKSQGVVVCCHPNLSMASKESFERCSLSPKSP